MPLGLTGTSLLHIVIYDGAHMETNQPCPPLQLSLSYNIGHTAVYIPSDSLRIKFRPPECKISLTHPASRVQPDDLQSELACGGIS